MKKIWMAIAMVMMLFSPAMAGQYLGKVEVVSEVEPGSRSGQLSWHSFAAGRVQVLICDLDGYVVRHLLDRQLEAGSHSVSWDGLDDQGQAVAGGAYVPVVRFTSQLGAVQVYDPTRFGWGAKLKVEDLSYDGQKVTYSLPQAALCQLRAGELPGGPCYKTIMHWQARRAGVHSQDWDGRDQMGVASVWRLAGFKLDMDAMALPVNSFLVTGSSEQAQRPASGSERIGLYPARGKDIFIHSLHPRRVCKDPALRVKVLSGLGFWGKKIKGRFIELEVTAKDKADKANLEREGCEVYAFAGGRFLGEVKTSRLPARIRLDTSGLKAGRHLLTVNLRSIEDHVGAWSCIVVK